MKFNADPTITFNDKTTGPAPEIIVPKVEPEHVTMEIYTDVPKKFMAKYNRYEPVIKDSTQMMTAKTCFRRYFYQIVLGRVSKESAIYFAWGSAYHKFREVLEMTYGVGEACPPVFSAERAMEAFTAAVNAGMTYWRKYGADQPVGSRFEFMTAGRLLASFQTAYEHWQREKMQGRIKVLAVEQVFNVALPNGDRTSGRADQIVRWNERLWGRDFKTTSKDEKYYNRTIEPNDQFTRYTYAESELTGEPIQGQMIEVLYNAKSTKTTQKGPNIFTLLASRTQWQVEEWTKDEEIWRWMLTKCREEDRYPMNESSCAFCEYHSVCTKPSEAAMMAQLESYFVVRPWDNSKIGVSD